MGNTSSAPSSPTSGDRHLASDPSGAVIERIDGFDSEKPLNFSKNSPDSHHAGEAQLPDGQLSAFDRRIADGRKQESLYKPAIGFTEDSALGDSEIVDHELSRDGSPLPARRRGRSAGTALSDTGLSDDMAVSHLRGTLAADLFSPDPSGTNTPTYDADNGSPAHGAASVGRSADRDHVIGSVSSALEGEATQSMDARISALTSEDDRIMETATKLDAMGLVGREDQDPAAVPTATMRDTFGQTQEGAVPFPPSLIPTEQRDLSLPCVTSGMDQPNSVAKKMHKEKIFSSGGSLADLPGSPMTPQNQLNEGGPAPSKTAAQSGRTRRSSANNPEGNIVVPTIIEWRGSGNEIFVTGTWCLWRAKTKLALNAAESQAKSDRYGRPVRVFQVVLDLPVGTHRLKFIVDEEWRCSEDMSTATDSGGNLLNWIEVRQPRARRVEAKATSRGSGYPADEASQSIPDKDASAARTGFDNNSKSSEVNASSLSRANYGPDYSDAMDDINLEEVFEPDEGDNYSREIPSVFLPYLAPFREPPESSRPRSGSSVLKSKKSSSKAPPAPPTLPRHLEKVILNAPLAPPPSTSWSSSASAAGIPASHPSSINNITAQLSQGAGRAAAGMPLPNSGEAAHQTHAGGVLNSAPSASPHQNMPISNTLSGTGGDDNSVLPTPNHVVLGHLAASSIRNGVLAVAATTRYRKKYVTTIYYKPIEA